MVTYTSTDFISAVKTNAHVPVGNTTFTETQILSLGDMCMRTLVAPKIASCRENYWLTTQTTVIDNSQNRYWFPSKALGSSIVDVKVLNGTYYIHLIRIEVSELYSTQYSANPGYGYFIEDASLRLLPATLSGSVVMWYYRIPSKLVPVSSCARITDITGNVLTVGSVPSTFVGGGELDLVSQTPGFNVLMKDDEPVSIVGNEITFAAVSDRVQVGDYVCLSGQSCVIQCPLEWIETLVQATTCKIYEIQGYATKLAKSEAILAEMVTNTMGLVSPRTIENPKVINAGGSLLYPRYAGWNLSTKINE